MSEPRPIRGSPLPLFDRLAQGYDALEEVPAGRILDAQRLRESVRQDLLRLLNTRASRRGAAQSAGGTVLDYGVPDFSALSPASDSDRNCLAKAIAERISAHEPRLRDVRVVVGPDAASPRSVEGVIVASLVIGEVYEPVTFHMAAGLGSAFPAVALR